MKFYFAGIAGVWMAGLVAACSAQSQPDPAPESPAPVEEMEVRPAIIVDGGEGEAVAFPLHPTNRLAHAESNSAGMSFFELQIPAGTPGAPPHIHTHEDEFFYVRQGTPTFMAGDAQQTLSPGGFVMLPRGGFHGFWNSGDVDAIVLVGTSSGKFDDFFDSVALEVAANENLSPPEVIEIVMRHGEERGMTIDMSKVPENARALYGLPPAE